QSVVDLAAGARVPVINGLSDLHHPCQVLSDCFTLLEHRGRLASVRVAFVGDGNNMVHSWMDAATRLGFSFVLACPPGYEPDPGYTDGWTGMGQEAEARARRRAFGPYQVNERVVALAGPRALVMHCLPAAPFGPHAYGTSFAGMGRSSRRWAFVASSSAA